MKRFWNIVIVLLAFPVLLIAQENVEHDNILKLKIGTGYQLDSYLSPLGYMGLQGGLGNEWWQPFRCDSTNHWSHVGRVDAYVINYHSSARTNKYTGFQLAFGWGAFYEWKWFDDRLRVHTGPYLEGNLNVREHASNVNKIVSLDIAIDLMAMGGISWSFYGKKNSYRLNYLLRTNLIGFDFLPEYWESYYEITEGVPGIARCSGHWNHNTVKHELTLDMQFPHTTWRVGAEHEFVKYGTDNLHFIRNQFSIILACRWKYRIQTNARL